MSESPRRKKKTTLQDIAKLCACSPTTVSRVLSGSDYPVNADIRESIIKTAAELGYLPPAGIRAQRGEPRRIAVLVPTLANPFYTALITEFENIVTKEEYHVAVFTTKSKNLAAVWDYALQKEVRGLLVTVPHIYSHFLENKRELERRNIKVVLADCPAPDNLYYSVSYDYEKGAYLGTEHLIEMGHRRIVYAGLELERESRELRVQGFVRAMREHELACGDEQILLYTESTADENTQTESGAHLAKRILSMPERPTAVVAVNDMVAFGILRYFHHEGIRVPEDISVIGFDDSLFCEMSYPALTTVKVQSEQMGRMAAMLLLNDMQGKGGEGAGISLEPYVVKRDSVSRVSKDL